MEAMYIQFTKVWIYRSWWWEQDGVDMLLPRFTARIHLLWHKLKISIRMMLVHLTAQQLIIIPKMPRKQVICFFMGRCRFLFFYYWTRILEKTQAGLQ